MANAVERGMPMTKLPEASYSKLRPHGIPKVPTIELADGDIQVDVVLSVVAGTVTGELERVVFNDGDQIRLFAAARIDGVRSRGRCGLADIELDENTVETLQSLAVVAQALAEEGWRMLEIEKRYAV